MANRFDMNVTVVRFLALLGLLAVGGTLPVYIALWIIIPSE